MSVTVEGRNGIRASIIAHSVTPTGDEILTAELDYHRYIHSEFMTHRVFSRNAASSRAIPVKQVISQVWNDPAIPVHWGANQSGMQAKQELTGLRLKAAVGLWKTAGKTAALIAMAMNKVGLHKQVANRILEPWQRIKVVMTTTEIANFFYLRNHKDAQPEIQELASCLWDAYQKSVPQELAEEEWHVPYVSLKNIPSGRYKGLTPYIITSECYEQLLTWDEAKKLSASLCAQVSYRKADESLEKALLIWDRLVGMTPVHASPFEHQATPIVDRDNFTDGVTHIDKWLNPWSGNLKGWIQHRQLIANNNIFGDERDD